MRIHNFTKGKLNGTDAEFLNCDSYIEGQGDAPRRIPTGAGPYFMYDPNNEIVCTIDPGKYGSFIEEAKKVEKDHSAPLRLFSATGSLLKAVVWEVEQGRPVRIHLQPAWWL